MIKLQLGKKGLTDEFILNLKKIFEEAESIRISLLKTATRDKNEMESWARKMTSELGNKFTYNLVGYTIILRKWRKSRTKKE